MSVSRYFLRPARNARVNEAIGSTMFDSDRSVAGITSSERGEDVMGRSNWAKADAARVQAVTEAAEAEIRNRTETCNAPAPTMTRCRFAKGHEGPHSFEAACPNCHGDVSLINVIIPLLYNTDAVTGLVTYRI